MTDLARRRREVIVWSVVFAASQANIVRVLGSADRTLLRTQLAPNAEAFRSALAELAERDPDGMRRLRAHLLPDTPHPAIYAAALRAGVRWSDAADPMPAALRSVLLALPAASAVQDWVENAAEWYLFDHPEAIADPLVPVLTVNSAVKWITALGVLGFLSQRTLRRWGRSIR